MNIAITGLNATDNPGPGIPVIRSLKDQDKSITIIGLLYDALEPGIYIPDMAKRSYLIPYPSSGTDALFERIAYIHSQEKLDLIIPTLDSELYGFLKIEPRLNEIGIQIYLPTKHNLDIRAKDKLSSFCEDNNIDFPKNINAVNLQQIYHLPNYLKYPVVVKGIFYDAYKAGNYEEAATYFHKISSKWGYPIIIQEFLKGDEYNVCALGDGEGNTLGAVPMRKLYITDKGKGWSGITIMDEELLNISRQIIKASRWRGGLELEFIKNSVDGKFYLLEINPRFPAWVYLTAASGANLPYAMVQLALQGKVDPIFNYEVGKIFVRCSWDLITNIHRFEEIATKGEFTL